MEKTVNAQENIDCKKFKINADEYLRIDGIWFKYIKDSYVVTNSPDLENYYLENFKNEL